MRPLQRFAIVSIRFYQRTYSSWRPSRCVFHPTCSEYAILAVEKHGLARGLKKTAGRLLRCRPGGGGHDLP